VTWTRVAVIYAVLAVLVGYLSLVDGPANEETAVTLEPPTPSASLLGTEADAVRVMTFQKDGRLIRASRDSGRWRPIEPMGARIPPDLFDAAIAALTAGQASEKISAESGHRLADYGLESPAATIELVVGDVPNRPITVLIGARNPTQTAVYARRSDEDAIYLVGMNLRYYIDLIFDAATKI
jgi:hypothetical protein